jgi:hypothetical protein
MSRKLADGVFGLGYGARLPHFVLFYFFSSFLGLAMLAESPSTYYTRLFGPLFFCSSSPFRFISYAGTRQESISHGIIFAFGLR